MEAVNPSAIIDLHTKAIRNLEDKAKEAINDIDVISGPEFPGGKVTTLEGHQSEV